MTKVIENYFIQQKYYKKTKTLEDIWQYIKIWRLKAKGALLDNDIRWHSKLLMQSL